MTKNIVIKSNEYLVLPILWTGQKISLSYNIHLAGSGAKITLFALILGKKEEKLNLNINIYHQKPNTESKIIIKGVLNENANVKFNGLVKIESGAKNCETSLSSRILLLSDKVKAQVAPSLEISEPDIKAGHSSTIGRINDLELFYLRSRGLSENSAKTLIVQGFLSSILSEFPKKIANEARNAIFRKTHSEAQPISFTS